jgi:Sulfotransferase domain
MDEKMEGMGSAGSELPSRGDEGREKSMPERLAEKNRRLKKLRQRLEAGNRELAELRAKLGAGGAGVETTGIKPENIIWIFCVGRSGSTWLAHMMGDLEGHARWNEPYVGALFGEFYYERFPHKRSKGSIMGDPFKDLWLRQIRRMVLEGAQARYPGLGPDGYVVIKEPHGSIGAPLMMEALPESRMILLVRDPRDVVSSALDGQKQESWTSRAPRWRETGKPKTLADTDPDRFVESRAKDYLRGMGKAREACDAHKGHKVLVRYENLRVDTFGEMKRVYSELSIPVDEEELERAVKKHSWENVPEEKKGEGKFYRKASPGSWREDLTEEQARIVEEITRPMLEAFYPDA